MEARMTTTHDAAARFLEHWAQVHERSVRRAVDDRDAAYARQFAAEFRAAAVALRGFSAADAATGTPLLPSLSRDPEPFPEN
jgi:hypothetical protein